MFLGAKEGSLSLIEKSTFWERNILFYLDNPDPRIRHKTIRDFSVTLAAFVVSIAEIFRFFISFLS
jgi:hypothetical protein